MELLHAARRNEQTAQGSARRETFRTTRNVLSAALRLGVSAADIAAELGLGTGGIQSRGSVEGTMRVSTFAAISVLPVEIINAWWVAGKIEFVESNPAGTIEYRASALVAAYVSHRLAITDAPVGATGPDERHPMSDDEKMRMQPCRRAG